MAVLGPLLIYVAAAAVGLAVLVFLWTGQAILGPGRATWLTAVPAHEPEGGWPRLAMIFAARNEAETVAPAARSMLGQSYPGLEVIAVDDRSTDGTGALLDALAAGHPTLRVLHVHELPAGWLGKNHALQTASELTDAEWLLFTDADVIFEPLALQRAVAYATAAGVDHLVVVPQTITDSEAERVFLTVFCMLFALWNPPWQVTDPRSKAAIGVGAFNLVRAEAFRAIGGLRRLSLSVDDDLKLGAALKFAGYRPALVMGQGAVSVRWHAGVGGMIRGLEKNFFAIADFRLGPAVAMAVVLIGLGILPYIALVAGPGWLRVLALCAIVLLAICLSTTRGQNGIAWYHALVLPVGAVGCLFALLRSVWLTLRRGGVRWRDHFYPLGELRAHAARRNAWLREVWLSTR